MNTTTHLARHMLAFKPNKDAARLCLYHYLIHHCDPDTPLNPLLFENFCRLALLHEHWQQNSLLLSQELQYVLQHYNETYMLDWNLKDFVFPDHWQVVLVKNSIEGIYIFEKWLSKWATNTKNKVIYTKDKNYLILMQNPDGEVEVVQATPAMLIRKGELEPLTMAIRLSYDESLELRANVTQYLQVAPSSYGRFRINKRQIKGMVIRGFVFQNQLLTDGRINEYPNFYYPLKVTEQYFVDRKSDPDYQELVEVLEKAVELFSLKHPEASSFGGAAFERGQTALENVFINDNVIQALVDQLGRQLNP